MEIVIVSDKQPPPSVVYVYTCQPERLGGNEVSTELKCLVQRAGHLLTGLIVRAHVLYAGQQLGQTLAQEHLGPRPLGRRTAHAV